jgi:hypothetical protein
MVSRECPQLYRAGVILHVPEHLLSIWVSASKSSTPQRMLQGCQHNENNGFNLEGGCWALIREELGLYEITRSELRQDKKKTASLCGAQKASEPARELFLAGAC